ncbi:Uncharacterised protein [Chromobacterium violaceum]|uniref:Uncharacterized protein n=1 Tax=Chromobacterium violaceum TaxID=536 RepID=A0A3S5DLM0_CHRVL|nr:Uncharacterised protein [Chromobacterium violaceum]
MKKPAANRPRGPTSAAHGDRPPARRASASPSATPPVAADRRPPGFPARTPIPARPRRGLAHRFVTRHRPRSQPASQRSAQHALDVPVQLARRVELVDREQYAVAGTPRAISSASRRTARTQLTESAVNTASTWLAAVHAWSRQRRPMTACPAAPDRAPAAPACPVPRSASPRPVPAPWLRRSHAEPAPGGRFLSARRTPSSRSRMQAGAPAFLLAPRHAEVQTQQVLRAQVDCQRRLGLLFTIPGNGGG